MLTERQVDNITRQFAVSRRMVVDICEAIDAERARDLPSPAMAEAIGEAIGEVKTEAIGEDIAEDEGNE